MIFNVMCEECSGIFEENNFFNKILYPNLHRCSRDVCIAAVINKNFFKKIIKNPYVFVLARFSSYEGQTILRKRSIEMATCVFIEKNHRNRVICNFRISDCGLFHTLCLAQMKGRQATNKYTYIAKHLSLSRMLMRDSRFEMDDPDNFDRNNKIFATTRKVQSIPNLSENNKKKIKLKLNHQLTSSSTSSPYEQSSKTISRKTDQ